MDNTPQMYGGLKKEDCIAASNLSFQYQNGESLVLNQINLVLERGKFYLLCGPTGSGKTSFIRTLNGLIPHFYRGLFYGYMRINGQDTVTSTTAFLAKDVGMVFQIPENQLFAMNVERELIFGLENLGIPPEQIHDRITSAINMTGIASLLKRAPFELSGGEQQKVAIASILALNPDIIILDEPLSNLDPQCSMEILHILKRLQIEQQKTILIVEHRLENILEYLDEILIFEKGQIIQRGSPQVILNQPLIYEKGIDLSPILLWFKQLQNQKIWTHDIPLDLSAQISGIISLFQKCSRTSPQLQNQTQIVFGINPIITMDHISFSYTSKYTENHALKDVSLSIMPGDVIGILGPNGAGKSTLVKSLTNLRHPQSGHIFIKNRETTDLPTYELAQEVGVMFQNPDHQLFASNVEEELRFSLKNLHLSADQEKQRIDNILNTLSITEFRNKSPFLISGGQKKRVGLATILCRDPEILVFDEPTIGQDAHQKEVLKNLINTFKLKGKTILIITHDMDFIVSIATRLILMRGGQIFADAKPAEIFQDQQALKHCALCLPRTVALINAVRQIIPWIPQDILSISQLQEVWQQCR